MINYYFNFIIISLFLNISIKINSFKYKFFININHDLKTKAA